MSLFFGGGGKAIKVKRIENIYVSFFGADQGHLKHLFPLTTSNLM